jgi:hypothetical protein
MDDIVISSNSIQELVKQMEYLKDAAKSSHFSLNTEKESLPSDSVVAFNIKLSHSSLKITDSRYNKFVQAYLTAKSEPERKGIVGWGLLTTSYFYKLYILRLNILLGGAIY